MAYKKYIKRGGKIYGPYLYHSRRVDDKVISEYYGSQKKSVYKNIFISLSILAILILGVYGFNQVKPYFSGKAIFNIAANYQEGQPLDGVLELSLRQGEMIPSSSKLVFNNNGNLFEYPLSQLISEKEIEGSYYVQGESLSGGGSGYGIPGEKVVHPEVYFSLDVLGSSEEESIVEENVTEETSVSEEIVGGETSVVENVVEESSKVEEKAEVKEEKKETKEENKNEPSSETPVTGNVISKLFKGVSNLFLGLTGTGKVTMNLKKTVDGSVSLENPFFSYDLLEGETAELKKGSVYVIGSDGKEEKIDDSAVSIDVSDGKVIVSTDYSAIEEGFGEDYIGNGQKTIRLNLSSLGVVFEKGNLSIDLVYAEKEIVSLVTSLGEGEVATNEILPEIPVVGDNVTASLNISNVTNQTIETNMEFVSSADLSKEEKADFLKYFGNTPISTEKSEIFNGRLIRNYKLGDYEIEYSYDYEGKITSALGEQMQEDLMKWVRDILREASKEEPVSEQVDSLVGNYSLFEEASSVENESI